MSPFLIQIRSILEKIDLSKTALANAVLAEEAKGFRIVTSEGDAVKDYATGEPLGTYPIDAVWPQNWCHIDVLEGDVDINGPDLAIAEGMPDSLVVALEDWIFNNEAEARAFLMRESAKP